MNKFNKKYNNDDVIELVDCLNKVLSKNDFAECVTYTDDGNVVVDAGLTAICLFADNKIIKNRFMRMLKDAKTYGVDPETHT